MKLKLLWVAHILFFISFLIPEVSLGQPANGAKDDSSKSTPKNEIQLNQVIFLDPMIISRRESDTRIMDSLIHYLDCTPKGAQVHVSIYMFNYEPLVAALERAYNRGVIVQMVIDNGRERSSKKVNKETIARFKSVIQSPSRMLIVESDTYPSAINHCKYVLFSEVDLPQGKARYVVFSTSHNFTLIGTKKIQDAVVFTHRELYDAYAYNWNEIALRSGSGMKNFTYREVDLGSIYAYFFPRRKNGVWDNADTYLEIFDKISDYATANVRVVMSSWSRVEVAEKLTELHKKGVKVEVIAKDMAASEPVLAELRRLKAAGAFVKIIKMSEKDTHSKITLIKGTWEEKPQELVFTGSHNYTDKALRYNNEVLLKLKDHHLFQQYDNYFDLLRDTM